MANNDFGDHLKQLREDRGFSVNQLAMYSGVSSAQISRIENGLRGVPKPDTITKLAVALKVPHNELMKRAGYIDEKGEDKEELDPIFLMTEIMKDYKYADPEELEKFKVETLKSLGFDEFLGTIDITDDSHLNKYKFQYKGKDVSEDKVKKILSFIRFVAQEEE